jgi:tRNA pseudouridine38-40 synthase
MTKAKLIVAYDGTDFCGFQRQPGLRTVQGELERALGRLLGRAVEVTGASRTDAGVHARAQVVHVDLAPGLRVPIERWQMALRYRLPQDLAVVAVEEVGEGFHARHDARCKTYRYTLDTTPRPSVFTVRYATPVYRTLDVEAMRGASLALVGRHDFTSFCAARAQQSDKTRTIFRLDIDEDGQGFVHISIRGNGFLHNMVRIIIGTLLEVGTARLVPDAVRAMLEARDRRAAGPTAPAQGLCLWRIEYER